jgi:hypothetical protein
MQSPLRGGCSPEGSLAINYKCCSMPFRGNFVTCTGNIRWPLLQFQSCYSFIVFGNSLPFGIKRIDNEFAHSRVFLFVKFSPRNSCPKCAPQFVHSISVRIPSGSGIRFIAFGRFSSKLGHPHPASNLLFDER